MDYYGNNDYRDYLAHHGVLGMHWGIRRYQPYGIGYQRKGGEDGKFVGGKSKTKSGLVGNAEAGSRSQKLKQTVANLNEKRIDRRARKDAKNKAALTILAKHARNNAYWGRYERKKLRKTERAINKRMTNQSYKQKYEQYSQSITKQDALKFAKTKLKTQKALRTLKSVGIQYTFNPYFRFAVNSALRQITHSSKRAANTASNAAKKMNTNRRNMKAWKESRALPGPRAKIIDDVPYKIIDVD